VVVGTRFTAVEPRVSCFRDTCNVYVLRDGSEAVLVDFGDGDVLDHLEELGVERVTDVVVTHHHRDQLGGLRRAVDAGIRIWVPPVEAALVAQADEHWRRRRTWNDYDLREDRFIPLSSVPVTGTASEYRTVRVGGFDVYTLPTPGHTVGSVTYLVEVDGRRLAFSGDLVYGDGKVWSLAATQWSYGGTEGQVSTVVSLEILAERAPDVVLPSHGGPIAEPARALARTSDRVQELLDMRRLSPWDVRDMVRRPWHAITPHFLRNRASFANNYALVSETGAALLFDVGYDVATGLTPTTERGARRTLLFPLDALRRDHGVERIEAAIPTHYHDDHVSGLNLVREVEGAAVWAPENVAPLIEAPERYDLPCLWYEPVAVDRRLPLGESFRWHEYELRIHAQPGHTMYAAAIEVEVDGKRILLVGDQQSNDGGRSLLNYQYRNRFRAHDYVASAELYRAVRPDILASGHWSPQEVDDELLDRLLADGRRLEALHHELLPDDALGVEGFAARIEPYRMRAKAGDRVELDVTVANPFDRAETATVRLVVPDGWDAPPEQRVDLAAHDEAVARFELRVGEGNGRVAADVTVGETKLGQQAEAHVTLDGEVP
jgi:glyoxylase-like metal-dependent hydrolase (beta-lactamase superfamily II)